MQALILAGGLGTRLRSCISDRPKSMANVDRKPFLEYLIEILRTQRVDHFVFCVGYMRHHIQEHFGDGSRWNVHIDYSIEEDLLGTGGALKRAEQYVHGTFLAINGDSFFEVDLDELIHFHANEKAERALDKEDRYLGVIALAKIQDAGRYGSISLGAGNRIKEFAEKTTANPAPSSVSSLINAGIYVLEPEILDLIPECQKVSMEREIFPAVVAGSGYLCGYSMDGFFVDIGTPSGYRRFQDYMQERRR